MAKNNLKATLQKEGITQVELSSPANVSTGSISKYINQKRTPSPTTMSKIVKGINQLSGKSYTTKDIFPNSKPSKKE